MSSLRDIEAAVSNLSATDLSAFRAWFAEFDAELWDRQFERDVLAGKLEKFGDEAVRDLREGRASWPQ